MGWPVARDCFASEARGACHLWLNAGRETQGPKWAGWSSEHQEWQITTGCHQWSHHVITPLHSWQLNQWPNRLGPGPLSQQVPAPRSWPGCSSDSCLGWVMAQWHGRGPRTAWLYHKMVQLDYLKWNAAPAGCLSSLSFSSNNSVFYW